MPRGYKLYLDDILESIAKIREYTENMDKARFVEDQKTIDAVIRNLEIIGEAIKQLSVLIKDKHPEVEWKRAAGMRDVLIHGYFGVDLDIVWEVVRDKLPVLERQMSEIMKETVE